jgi:hypothetical protein
MIVIHQVISAINVNLHMKHAHVTRPDLKLILANVHIVVRFITKHVLAIQPIIHVQNVVVPNHVHVIQILQAHVLQILQIHVIPTHQVIVLQTRQVRLLHVV